MTTIGFPSRAQCNSCGGLLEPAGDDWLHLDNTGCTRFGEPVLCGECAMPAVVGALACAHHSGLSSWPANIRLRPGIAATFKLEE